MKNVQVKIENKEQALKYKAALESLGEEIHLGYFVGAYGTRDQSLLYKTELGWVCGSREAGRATIPFAELVQGLMLDKAMHITVDGKALKVGDEYFKAFQLGSGRWTVYTRPSRLFRDSFVISKPGKYKAFASHENAKAWVKNVNPPVILTTQDGKDLRAGDQYFEAYKVEGTWFIDDQMQPLLREDDVFTDPENNKAFADFEDGEDWIKKQNALVVLRTVDGVDLRLGDPYYFTYLVAGDKYCDVIAASVLESNDGVLLRPDWKAFADKDAAEAWIKQENSPVLLTTVDGKPLKIGDTYHEVYRFYPMPWSLNRPSEQYLSANDDVITEPDTSKAFASIDAAEAWIKQQNKSALRSEDGKVLREGDKYYKVRLSDFTIHPVTNLRKRHSVISKPHLSKAFSTKKAAEAWVKLQRPAVLTTEDGVDLREGDVVYVPQRVVYTRNEYSSVRPMYVERLMATSKSHFFASKEAAEAWVKAQNNRQYVTDGGYAHITKERVTFFCDGNPLGVHMDAKDLIEIYNLYKTI